MENATAILVEKLKTRLLRETRAREQAEELLEAKSLELFHNAEKLKKRLARENRAREEAERLLEGKSLELYKASESLRDANERLEEAVKSRTAELEDALIEAQRANEVKSQFLASMSHELRTPLNGIQGMIDLARANATDPEQRQFLDHAARSGDTLAALLGDLLDISKIEANHVEIAHERFDPEDLVKDLRQMFRSNAASKGLDFAVQARGIPAGKELLGDRLRIHQVVWNLVSNALKFTDKGRIGVDIDLRVVEDQPRLCVDVQDTGIGIPTHQAESIFERFVQLGDNYRKSKGTGLGLAICRRLVELMHGKMTLTSQPGEGSCFSFWVPVSVVDATQSVDKFARTTDRLATALQHNSQASIAVIDDSPANVILAKASLVKAGFDVHTAKNGLEGLSLLQDQPCDLILLDLSMPDIDGFEVLRRLRGERIGPNISTKVVALTAHVLPSTRLKVADEGFDGYLGKPIRPVELVEAVNEFLTQ